MLNTAIVCHGAVVIKLGCYGCSIVWYGAVMCWPMLKKEKVWQIERSLYFTVS